MMEASKFIQFQHTSRIGMVWEELYQDYKGAPYEQTGALGAWRIKFKKKAYESA